MQSILRGCHSGRIVGSPSVLRAIWTHNVSLKHADALRCAVPCLTRRWSHVPKKSLDHPIESVYDPDNVEKGWYEWWESKGYFKPSSTGNKNYSIVLPPPNVTGSLHIGHALTGALQDSLIRWKRMNGYNVLWQPGMDHAGIATQVVVEKKLKREKNVTRHDLGREKFLEEVWKWKEQFGGRIKHQMRKLGSSLDWSRDVFTMDEQYSKAVIETFVRLYDHGLIYRDNRLVNWCPTLKTAISDIEVEYITIEKTTKIDIPSTGKKVPFGVLHTFVYKIEGGGEIPISTTRLETMLGDTAIAVHPDDERYKQFHGKFAIHPFLDRKIPIVCDAELVNMEFGTGAVKVTPAHSFEDDQCARRNNLPYINILNPDGTLNNECGEFSGQDRFEARRNIVKKLTEMGLFKGETQNHPMRLAICSRSKDVLEPMLMPQWYVKSAGLAAKAAQFVRDGTIKIEPPQYDKIWFNWLDNIHDWCISRQLWWGHRIPAYRVVMKGETSSSNIKEQKWVVAHTREEAESKAMKQFPGLTPDNFTLEQDEDVLDTWFSSAIYPLASQGWPAARNGTTAGDSEASRLLNKFYPLSVMETGSDILFFWVARMAMLCTFLSETDGVPPGKQHPFNTVYLHPVVRDAQGRKMSKSLGNVIDPMNIIYGISLQEMQKSLSDNTSNLDPREVERASKQMKQDFPNGIAKCGADALRFALAAYTEQGRQINLDVNRVLNYRFFCNKMWQATRFALNNFATLKYTTHYESPAELLTSKRPEAQLMIINKWVLSRLHAAVDKFNSCMDALNFSDATQAIYSFFLYDLCDIYLEFIKPIMYNADNKFSQEQQQATMDILHCCLDTSLRLMHPFMPFVSEELWQRLPPGPHHKTSESIMIARFPQAQDYAMYADAQVENQVQQIMSVIRAVRSIKHSRPQTTTELYVSLASSAKDANNTAGMSAAELHDLLQDNASDIIRLSKMSEMKILFDAEALKGSAVEVVNEVCKVFVPIPASVIDSELKKMQTQREVLIKSVERAHAKVKAVEQNKDKVPQSVRDKERQSLEQLEKELASVEANIKELLDCKSD